MGIGNEKSRKWFIYRIVEIDQRMECGVVHLYLIGRIQQRAANRSLTKEFY